MPLTVAGRGVHDLPVNAVFSLVLPAGAVVLLSACGGVNRPLDSSFNPLDSPGMRGGADVVDVTGPAYTPGQWLETTISSTAFFYKIPKGNDQPNKLLPSGTVLKVIATEGTYVQVELESGDVGYVPAIMVAERPTADQVPIVPLGPDGSVLEPIPGIHTPAPEPEVAPLDVSPVGETPGLIDPGVEIE
jgi:hypothetical protein